MAILFKSKDKYIVKELDLNSVELLSLDYGEILDVKIEIEDKRSITQSQRNYIFALCSDIENYVGTDKELLRYNFMSHCNISSLTKCSMTKAKLIIEEILDYCIINQIPITLKSRQNANFELNDKRIYMLTLTRSCLLCGKTAQLHHFNCRVGVGYNRKKISHIGMQIIPLCYNHHVEIHAIGDLEFSKKYHIEKGITVDKRIDDFIKGKKIDVFKGDLKEGVKNE